MSINASRWHFFCLFLKDFINLFSERGEGKEKERECVVASHAPPTGDPGMCPDLDLNWQPLGLQASTQSTEPYQPGQLMALLSSSMSLLIFCFVDLSISGREWVGVSNSYSRFTYFSLHFYLFLPHSLILCC